jgi:hypothetical protein
MAMAMVVPAAVAAEMVVVGSGRRVWMGRWLQLLQQNDATNPQPNGQQWPFVVPAATVTDQLAAMPDNSGATKTTRKTNVGPWQQGNNTGGYGNAGNNGPPSSPTDREDNDTAACNNQGNPTTVEVNGGDADAGTLSVVLALLNTPNHDNNADNDDANAKDASGKKTLVRDTTTAGGNNGNADAGMLSIVLAVQWRWWLPCIRIALCPLLP